MDCSCHSNNINGNILNNNILNNNIFNSNTINNIESYQPYPSYPNYITYINKSEREIAGPFPEFPLSQSSPVFKRCKFNKPYVGLFNNIKPKRKPYNTSYF